MVLYRLTPFLSPQSLPASLMGRQGSRELKMKNVKLKMKVKADYILNS
jgi:hypothetical protein